MTLHGDRLLVEDILNRTTHLKEMHDEALPDRARFRAIMNGGEQGLAALLGPALKNMDSELLPAPNLLVSALDRLAQKIGRAPALDVHITNPRDSERNKKKKDNTDPGSLGEFHEREKASMSLISEGKGGLQFSITQKRTKDLNTHEKLGTLNFGDENFYKIATICSEKVGDKVKNVLGSVKNMTNNINGYFTEKSRSEAISSGSEAINDAKQLTTSLQSDMQERPTNESKEPAEQQEEVINYNVLMEMIGKEAKQAFQEEVIEEATFSSFNFPYDGN